MTTLHDIGVVTNYGPKRARPRRVLSRMLPAVRKVLRRTRGSMWFWMDRDLKASRARGGPGWFGRGEWSLGTLSPDGLKGTIVYGWFIAIGPRALIVLKGGSK